MRPPHFIFAQGLCDLFDAYLFHIFQTFGNVTVAALAEASVEVGGGEEVTPRLRKTLLRIGGYPADYVPGSRPSDMTTVTAIGGSPGGPGGTKTVVTAAASSTDRWRRSSLFKATRDKLAGLAPNWPEWASSAEMIKIFLWNYIRD
jgi:hypothetical protein